jgi:mRNA-degrading endonuclease toxin of MazEF toxin-antitoxin module
MKRGEIYRTEARIAERGDKAGFYVVVSRDFIAGNDHIATVICAPVYSESLNLRSEMLVGADEGLPRESVIRCDFLTLIFKSRLKILVGTLSQARQRELSRALAYALQIQHG